MLLGTLFLLLAPLCNIQSEIGHGRQRKAVTTDFTLCLDYIMPCSEKFLTAFRVIFHAATNFQTELIIIIKKNLLAMYQLFIPAL